MQRALDEMERRREVQIQFNEEHNITPKGITKSVSDVMEGAYSTGDRTRKSRASAKSLRELVDASPELVAQRIKKLEDQMLKHARDLEFEEAARIRDEIAEIKSEYLTMPNSQAG